MTYKIFLLFSEQKKDSIMCFSSMWPCVLVFWKGLGFCLCLQKISEVTDTRVSHLHFPFTRRLCQFCKSAVYSSSGFTNSALLCKRHLQVVVFVHTQTGQGCLCISVLPNLKTTSCTNRLLQEMWEVNGKRKWVQEKHGDSGVTCKGSVQLPSEFDFKP